MTPFSGGAHFHPKGPVIEYGGPARVGSPTPGIAPPMMGPGVLGPDDDGAAAAASVRHSVSACAARTGRSSAKGGARPQTGVAPPAASAEKGTKSDWWLGRVPGSAAPPAWLQHSALVASPHRSSAKRHAQAREIALLRATMEADAAIADAASLLHSKSTPAFGVRPATSRRGASALAPIGAE